MKTIAVVGYSNSGKTTVVSQLAKWFQDQGIKVAVLKHASHGYQMDTQGKDSQVHFKAGINIVAVAGPDAFTIHRRTPIEAGLDEICTYLDDCELVLVEGYKNHPGPKVELLRQGISEQRLSIEGVVAVVTDWPDLVAEEPTFNYKEIDKLARYLLSEVLKS